MQYQLKNFNKLYHLIIEGSFHMLKDQLDKLDLSKIKKFHKYNDFPEGKDIDITNQLSKYQLCEDISKVILTQHCIKSKKENEIHGINYVNLPKERFFKFSSICINNAITQLLKRKKSINLYYDSYRIETQFQDLNTNINFKLCFQTNAKSAYEIEIKLITIFYPNTHQIKLKRKIETSSGKQDSYITKKLFLENTNIHDLKIIAFHFSSI